MNSNNVIKPIFIGIAGGTGVGKSTLCTTLIDKYPDEIGLIQLDDYFKPSNLVPRIEEHENWDHPDALYLNKLFNDLADLSNGMSVVISTKNERLNPDYKKTDKRIPVEFQPKKLMLIEGFLVLFDERIRKLLSSSIWLDLSHDVRWSRRVHFKYQEYKEKVLHPMYKEFAEPTKKHADHIIDVSDLSKQEVFEKVEEIIKVFLKVN